MPWLIKPAQLDKFRKTQKNISIFDASWFLSTEGRHAEQEFTAAHIPGARFLDLNNFHDEKSPLPNMLIRDEEVIKKKLAALNIGSDNKIIFYDNSKLMTSCRALWMLKVFGHNPHQLYILDGGFQAWQHYGGKVEIGPSKNSPPKNYNLTFQAHYVRTLLQMKTNVHHPLEQVIDMRHAVRFAGGKESRSGLRPGHMPKSFSFPYTTMFELDGTWKPIERIRKQLHGIGVDLNKRIVTMCGSGITAAILNFALDLMDDTEHALYDGSWSEWASEQLYPGESDLNERPVIRSVDA